MEKLIIIIPIAQEKIVVGIALYQNDNPTVASMCEGSLVGII